MKSQGSSPDDSKLPRIASLQLLIGTSTATIIILVLIASIATLAWKPEDDANYFITALGAIVSGLNVLFTLWLLRTAQTQLNDARQEAHKTFDSLKQQEKQLQGQLDQAQLSHEAERTEAATSLIVARDAVDEALRARIDQLAPRVSFSVKEFTLWLVWREPGSTEDFRTQLTAGETLDFSDSSRNVAIDISLSWTLKNWGNEPVSTTFPAPLDMPSTLLMPLEERIIRHPIRAVKPMLTQAIHDGYKFDNSTNPILVQVADLGGQAYDNLEWTGEIRPIIFVGNEIKVNDGWNTRMMQYGIRRRHYNFLERRALAEASAHASSPSMP